MKAIATAFIWTMILAFLAGVIIGIGLDYIGYDWYIGPLFTMAISVIDGWVKARGLLSKRLGHKDQARVITTDRSIPVNFDFLLPGRGETVSLADKVYIRLPNGEEISQAEIERFIAIAWSRQERGKNGLSRAYWLRIARPAWSRDRYQAMVDTLSSGGFIQGRIPGRAGRIIADYQTIIKNLRGE